MCSTYKQKTGRRQFIGLLLAGAGAGALGSWQAGAAVVKRPLPVVNLDFLKSHVALRRRHCWTDSSAHAWQLREAQPFSRVTVHHQGAGIVRSAHENAVAADIDAVFGGHRRIGYADIGYHFVVDTNGRVWEGRSLAYAGAHVAGHNADNIGILALGNFNRQKPSTAIVVTLQKLVAALQQHYSIRADHVFGHRELGASDCPGNHLFPRVKAIRTALVAERKRKASKGV